MRMRLHVQYPPTIEYAAKHAEIIVKATKDINGIELDYSPESLKEVDRIVLGFHESGLKLKQVAETVFSFGCYAGEVIIRNLGGRWTNPPESLRKIFGPQTLMVELPGEQFWSPVEKAFKLMENGEEDSLAYLYSVIAHPGQNDKPE